MRPESGNIGNDAAPQRPLLLDRRGAAMLALAVCVYEGLHLYRYVFPAHVDAEPPYGSGPVFVIASVLSIAFIAAAVRKSPSPAERTVFGAAGAAFALALAARLLPVGLPAVQVLEILKTVAWLIGGAASLTLLTSSKPPQAGA